MSCPKHMSDLLKVCSVLPVFAVMPAMAELPVPVNGVVSDASISNETGGGYRLDKMDMDLTVVNSEFTNNSNDGWAGAAWARGHKLTLVNTDFSGNKASSGGAVGGWDGSVLNVNGGIFKNNHAVYDGGAIASYSGLMIAGVTFDGNTAQYDVDASGVYNVAVDDDMPIGGGAIALGAVSNTTVAAIDTTTFKNNKSGKNGGAIGTRLGKNANNKDAKLDVSATFENNVAAQNGGAIYNTFYANNGLGKGNGVTVTGAFVGNEAGQKGGAIYNDGTVDLGGNAGGVLTLNQAKFTGNVAGADGGAIYNDGTLKINGGEFVGNFAKSQAGAIYNHGAADKAGNTASIRLEDVVFTGNMASENGGAIYNESGAGMVLAGKNLFSQNVAAKKANDIYNDGYIKIEGGETSLGGGVSGNGTLDIASGAVLNIGAATVNQSKINIDGTVNASVLNGGSRGNGKLFGDVTGTGVINLDVASVGTYNIFNKDNDIQVNVGNTYLVQNNGADGVVVSTKPVDMLVEDAGISQVTAGTLVGLANSSDKSVQRISLLAQQALNSGKMDVLEKESVKLNPEATVVAQSVALATHNQVLSLAAGRMAGGAGMVGASVAQSRNASSYYGGGASSYYGGGRAGGDAAQENGFWIHGLFNKSKYADHFHGYTRGFAVGADTLINRKYTLGAGFAYNASDIHSGSRDTDVDNKTLFVYGQYKPNKWFLNGTVAYTMAEYTESSSPFGMVLESVHDVDTFGAQMTTGYEFASGLVPNVGLRYLHTTQDEYSNGVNTVKALDTDFLTGVAGIKYSFLVHDGKTLQLRPELHAAATYDIVSDDAVATVLIPGVGTSYTIESDNLSQWGGEFGVGLNMRYKGMEISLMYDLGLRQDYISQTGMIKIRSYF